MRSANAGFLEKRKELKAERVLAEEQVTRVQAENTALGHQINRAQSALHASTKEQAATLSQLEAELQRARDGRVWARVREEEVRRGRAEEESARLQHDVDRLLSEANGRSREHAAEKQELKYLRHRVKELQEKVALCDLKSNRKFFEVEPIAEENDQLRRRIEKQVCTPSALTHAFASCTFCSSLTLSPHPVSTAPLRCCALSAPQSSAPPQEVEISKLKEITEPDTDYFHRGGFTLPVDLAIAECVTKAHVSRNQVPPLFIFFARFYRIKLPTRKTRVPFKKVDGKMMYVEREMLMTPGRTHVQQVCATLNQAHKLQIGVQLLETEGDSYCYVSDGAESLQSEWLSQLLSRRDANGKLQCTALDLSLLHSKTAEAQKVAMTESLRLIAETCRDVGITEEVSPRLLEFKPDATINDRAAAARKAARLARGGDGSGGAGDVADDPTCAHHAVTNVLEAGRKAVDAIMREAMNITDEQAESVASKVKAMRTCVGWFSSPACSLIYQCSKYVALFSSKGYAIGAKFRKWLQAEEKMKAEERLEGELLGAVEDMLSICGSRDYVFFMDAAVTERFSQVGSLLTFLEEEKDMAAEAGGKLRNSILTGFGSDTIMAAVRALAIICDAVLWELLRAIGGDDHILDVLPKMWPTTLAFFEKAAESPGEVVDGTLMLKIEGGREAKVTPRAKRAATDMQRIRRVAVGDPLVARMVGAACKAMVEATRNHASEFLPGGICASDKITPEMRVRLSGCPMTSTGAER
eukprot:7381210-Prymnesium_polylepis.1